MGIVFYVIGLNATVSGAGIVLSLVGFSTLVHDYYAPCMASASAVAADIVPHDEVEQLVLMTLWRASESRHAPRYAKTYLRRAAVNAVIDERRRILLSRLRRPLSLDALDHEMPDFARPDGIDRHDDADHASSIEASERRYFGRHEVVASRARAQGWRLSKFERSYPERRI